MANRKTLRPERRQTIVEEVRRIASRELRALLVANKEMFRAIDRHNHFVRDVECKHPGHDFLAVLGGGGPVAKEWSRLWAARAKALDRRRAAEQDLAAVLDDVLSAHGLPMQVEPDGMSWEDRARMTKEQADAALPEGLKIKEQLLRESREEAKAAVEDEPLDDGKWTETTHRTRSKKRRGQSR